MRATCVLNCVHCAFQDFPNKGFPFVGSFVRNCVPFAFSKRSPCVSCASCVPAYSIPSELFSPLRACPFFCPLLFPRAILLPYLLRSCRASVFRSFPSAFPIMFFMRRFPRAFRAGFPSVARPVPSPKSPVRFLTLCPVCYRELCQCIVLQSSRALLALLAVFLFLFAFSGASCGFR